MLGHAGFAPMEPDAHGLDAWFARFDAFQFAHEESEATLLCVAVHASDERITLFWLNTRGVETQPTLSLPINGHGRRLLAAIAAA